MNNVPTARHEEIGLSSKYLSTVASRRALFVVFTLSGFAGLIYESIWSHYLKLMLGHAAYAQTLVLVLFMGGMALGSWACSRISARIPSPLIAYAGAELILGLIAFGFDPIFRGLLAWLLEVAAPALASAWAIELLKWTTAALLILPPCVLLGATFPLISAGVLRQEPGSAGNALGWLYFTNSLGAVAGVLTSGFVLINLVGLPGTLMTAGLCNVLLALTVYGLAKRIDDRTPIPEPEQRAGSALADGSGQLAGSVNVLLATAFLTGAASFFYEIGWIRMLSLVLGSATHSFELMLGAFILGIALGSLYIRNRIDGVFAPLRVLAWVQVLMGTAALGTLVVYGWSFDWMSAIVRTLARTNTGYAWFNFLSQAICWALMLPVTFFAGMTLPLITASMLRGGGGESVVGRVYAANTWGAIAGVVLAVNLVMPALGLRNVVVVGATIDLALGFWLLSRNGIPKRSTEFLLAAFCLVLSLGIVSLVRFDASRLASGVYRDGTTRPGWDSVWRQDGRTASVDVVAYPGTGRMTIMTNGKPDASLNLDGVAEDDYTQITLGVLPLLVKPDARDVAVIGVGSGRSTHVLLGSATVEEVHTIEIEPAMVQGARLFGPLVERVFKDPRSRIHIEDAKTYFARHQQQYDVIVSEPSNPWVSGVASLFSQEYYAQVKRHLAPGGVFVQWLQLYEFHDTLLASVLKALGSEFAHYVIFAADDMDLLILAVPEGRVPEPRADVLQWPGLKTLASSIGLRNREDLAARYVGSRETIEPWVNSFGVPINSDYFPFLDQNAAKQRFLKGSATSLVGAHPVLHRIAFVDPRLGDVSFVPLLRATGEAQNAHGLWAYLEWKHVDGGRGTMPPHAAAVLDEAIRLESVLSGCLPEEVRQVWIPAVQRMGMNLWPYIEGQHAGAILKVLRKHECKGATSEIVDRWLDFLEVMAQRDWSGVMARSEVLISEIKEPPALLVRELLLAELMRNGPEGLRRRLQQLGARNLPDEPSIRYLRAVGGLYE